MNEKPLFTLASVRAPQGALQRVIAAIERKQRESRLWRIRISIGASIASLAALIPVGNSLAQSFAASHFTAYVSLLGDSVALTYWKEISVSILESLPAATLTITIVLVGVLLWSMRTAFRSIGNTAFQHA